MMERMKISEFWFFPLHKSLSFFSNKNTVSSKKGKQNKTKKENCSLKMQSCAVWIAGPDLCTRTMESSRIERVSFLGIDTTSNTHQESVE